MLQGPSGSGKSDLALRLIDGGALLVADDQVDVTVSDGCVLARPPSATAGRIEARGIGILKAPSTPSTTVAIIIDMVPGEAVERLPEGDFSNVFGVPLPRFRINPFEASAAAKLRLAVANLIAARTAPEPKP